MIRRGTNKQFGLSKCKPYYLKFFNMNFSSKWFFNLTSKNEYSSGAACMQAICAIEYVASLTMARFRL